MIFTRLPLDRPRITQPFAVDYIGGGFYQKFGLKGHNGLDFSAATGTPCYAVADGMVELFGGPQEGGYGLGARLYVSLTADSRLAVTYGHLQKVLKTGPVRLGDLIGECDSTGASTGPHLHLGIRQELRNGNSWVVHNYNNGYLGYLDPEQFFPIDAFKTPVEKRYGQEDTWLGRVAFAPNFLYFIKTQKRAPVFYEYNALRYGMWDLRTVIDSAMWPVWSEYTKPEALKKGLIK